jgi:DHA1 family tetracycline resistance protein-like MFS transporter
VYKMLSSPLFLMASTIFIDFADLGLILPLLPFLTQHLGANPTKVGLVLTIYALAQFIFTPILGSLLDRFGHKPIIVASLLIEAFSLMLTGFAGSLLVLLISHFIGGIVASNIGSAQAVVADVTPPECTRYGNDWRCNRPVLRD